MTCARQTLFEPNRFFYPNSDFLYIYFFGSLKEKTIDKMRVIEAIRISDFWSLLEIKGISKCHAFNAFSASHPRWFQVVGALPLPIFAPP